MPEIILLKSFYRATKKLFKKSDIEMLSKILKENPKAGDVIPGSGGVRKLRFALNKGKRGGARIIYFVHDSKGRIFLITAYAKNDKEDISKADINKFKNLTDELKACW